MAHGSDEAFEVTVDGGGEEATAFRGLGAVGVRGAFGSEEDGAWGGGLGLPVDFEAEVSFEDVEDFVFVAVDVERG